MTKSTKSNLTDSQLEKQIEYLGWIYEGKIRTHNSILLHTQIALVGGFVFFCMSWALSSTVGVFFAFVIVLWITLSNNKKVKPLAADATRLKAKIHELYMERLK